MAKIPSKKISKSDSDIARKSSKSSSRNASDDADVDDESGESETASSGPSTKRESVGHRDKAWTEYAVNLRKRMFLEGKYELTLTVEEIKRNSGSDSTLSDLRNPKYWKAVRDAKTGWDTLTKNGVEVEFEVEDDGLVHKLVFSLDETWSGVLERAIKRK